MLKSRRIQTAFNICALTAFLMTGLAFQVQAGTQYRGELGALSRTKDSVFDEFYTRQDINFSAYDKVLIKPVGVIYGRDRYFKKYSARDLESRQTYLRDALVEGFSSTHEVVEEAGPGVLVIEASITHLRNNKPTFDQLSDNVSLSWSGSFQAGAAGFQADILDGATGENVAAVSDRRSVPYIGFHIKNQYTTWGDAEDFMDRWARALPQRLE